MLHEVAIDSYSNRGHIYSHDKLFTDESLSVFANRQAQHSYFAYSPDAEQFIEDNGAMNSRFTGSCYMPHLILDFDGDASSLGTTTVELRQFVRYLLRHQGIPDECLSVWFSGKKGYHIYIDGALYGVTPSATLPAIIKATVKKHYAHPCVDLVPIGVAGMIRMPYSLHPDTGLRKVPVPLHDLLQFDTDALLDTLLASPPTHPTTNADLFTTTNPTPLLKGLIQPAPAYAAEGALSVTKHDPTRMVTCMQNLIVRGPEKGRRHQDTLRLASWLWRGGVPLEGAVRVLEGWMDRSEVERIVRSTYEKGYSYGCNDSVMKEFCDRKCVFSKTRDYTMTVSMGNSLVDSISEHAKRLKDGKAFNVYQLYGAPQGSYMVTPGEMIVVTSDTGMGKSLFVQDMINRIKRKVVYVNTEMPEHLLARRFVQNSFGYTKHEVIRNLVNINNAQSFAESMDHIYMVSRSPTIELMKRTVEDHKPDILVVDTTDGIIVPEAGNSDMWQMKRVIDGLRDIAHDHNVIVISVHHLNKGGARAIKGEGYKQDKRPISLEDLSGRRDIVTKFDHVWTLEGERFQPNRTLRSAKVRDEKEMRLPLNFDFTTMKVTLQQPTGEKETW